MKRIGILYLIAAMALGLTLLLSLLSGEVALTLPELWRGLIGSDERLATILIWDIRLPRSVLAVLTGFGLGATGAAAQGLLRNPLAEPGILGASNAAALGAVIAIYLGLAGTTSFWVPVAAIAGALLSVVALLALAGQGVSSLRLILAGFAISALAGAGIALALNLSPNMFAALEIAFWLLGAVENRSWAHVLIVLPGFVFGIVLILANRRALDALALGEDVARSLGVAFRRLRLTMTLGISFVVGSLVAATGVIGFIGLLAPHLVRPLTSALPSRTVLPAGFLGAILVLAADSVIRVLPTQSELKLGVVTAFLGVPLLLYLLRRETLVQDMT
jgi:iron complex transport system permease protein